MKKTLAKTKKNFTQKVKETLDKLNVLHYTTIIVLILLTILLKSHLPAIILMLILYITDIIFDFILKFTIRPIYSMFPIGLELVLFNTVIAALAFGPVIGALAGILFGITYYWIVFDFSSTFQIANIPAYALIGWLAGTLSFGSVIALGIVLTIIYDLITGIASIFLGGKPLKALIFGVTNFLFNLWLFTNISPIIIRILGL